MGISATKDESGEAAPPPDLTAVLVQGADRDPESIRRAVEGAGYGDVWLRVQSLPAVALTQVEVIDERGQPRVDPALVAALSTDGKAAFVHANRGAAQGLVHGFDHGKELAGWVGKPEEIDLHLGPMFGRKLAAIVAADDGSRQHPFFASSHMTALVRGRKLIAPPGMPLGLGTFGFHDRLFAAAGEERVTLCAFDQAALARAWSDTAGTALAARITSLPDRLLGPLATLKAEVAAGLASLGDKTPAQAGYTSQRALELLMLADAYVFAGGDAASFVDGRVLPMFTLSASEAPLDDPDEAEALEESASVLAAMVEILPYKSPEGALLEQIADDEVRPLAPWVKPGEEYVGAAFLLRAERLRTLLGGLDQRDLAARVDRFFRAWWKAQTDETHGADYEAWRKKLEEKGGADVNRFMTDWTEWRVVLEMAALNGLQPALLFYGDAAEQA